MKYNVRNATYLKSNNYSYKIIGKTSLSLLPFIIYMMYLNITNLNFSFLNLFTPILIVLITLLLLTILEYIYNIMIRNKKNIIYILGNTYIIYYALIIGIIFPYNMFFLWYILAISLGYIFFKGTIHLFKRAFISFPIISLAIIFIIYEILGYNNNDWLFLNTKFNYIAIILIVIAFLFLIINKSIKFKTTISYLLAIIISFCIYGLIKGDTSLFTVALSFSNLFIALYIINDNYITPNYSYGQIIMGIIFAILALLIYRINIDVYLVLVLFVGGALSFLINTLLLMISYQKKLKIILLTILLIILLLLAIL